jgi:hypothetical protein
MVRLLNVVLPPIPHPQLSHALFGVGEGASIPKILSKNTKTKLRNRPKTNPSVENKFRVDCRIRQEKKLT